MKFDKDPEKIIRKLELSRGLLFSIFNKFPETKWFEKNILGEWSINDIVIHLIGWDELLLSQAKEWLLGKEPDSYNTIDENEHNKNYIKEHKIDSKSDTLEKLTVSTQKILRFLNSLSDNQVKYALKHESLIDLDLYSHDMEHYKQLEKLLKV